MTMKVLTLVIDDSDADTDTSPLSTAISNLEYDNYEIISYSEMEIQ